MFIGVIWQLHCYYRLVSNDDNSNMGTPEEWCAEKLSKLLNEELRISTLEEIKDHFSTLSQNEATRTANLLQLPLVFDCLNDSDS